MIVETPVLLDSYIRKVKLILNDTHFECPLQVIKSKPQLLHKAIIQASIEQLPQIPNCSHGKCAITKASRNRVHRNGTTNVCTRGWADESLA